ncbi:hypothetical protein [Rothia nasimurium]|uniref:hypothetical protein n=1 Tax=Rothia nasimurium TaxID=85336 RepID=UPI001F2ACF5B|nr:hypothetical protein [Rothia nasimurium]
MNIIETKIISSPEGHNPSAASLRENVEVAAQGNPVVSMRYLAQALLQTMDELEAVKAEVAELKKKN